MSRSRDMAGRIGPRAIAAGLALFLLSGAALAQPADLVVRNARVWTDGPESGAAFFAVRNGRFVHVGDPDESLIGRRTEVIDAGNRRVLPGLIDAHAHMLSGGSHLSQVNLRPAESKQDFIRRVEAWARSLPEDAWVLGGRWTTEDWASERDPSREWLDDATGGRPAYLPRMDGHSALVNSEALRRAGIDEHAPPDPEGGVIDRDPQTGEPTGVLRESAMGLVSRLIPEPTTQDKMRALRRAVTHANSFGVTAVGDIPGMDDMEAYARLNEETPSVRFFLYPVAGDWRAAHEEIRGHEIHDGRVQFRGFKAYMDGSLGSRTAYMAEPFDNNPDHEHDWRGLLREGIEDGRFRRNAQAAADLGVQTIAHAIGDQANHLLLDTLEQVYGPSLRASRCRSEHAQHLLPGDVARFGRLGVIASMQPYHKADDARYAEDYIGPERSESSYAFRSLLENGAVVAFGSDWPVVTISPWLGIEAAVTGKTLAGQRWQTQESISVEEALKCYTSRAAYACFAEDEIGRIREGLAADFLVLNQDPFSARVDWDEIGAEMVFVGGERVDLTRGGE